MRDRAARAFCYAMLASLLAHALVLVALPAAREFAALVPPEAEPLIARVEHLEPPPAPKPAPVLEVRKPAPPAPVAVAKTVPEPAPAPPMRVAAPQTAPEQAEPAPPPGVAPAAVPAPAPALAPAPPPAIDPRIRREYAQRINAAAEDYKIYPRAAIDNHWRGEVVLVMAIAADGGIAALRVTRSSGHKVLDDQALEMFARAKPQVRLPAALRGRSFELELLAVFRFERRP